MLHLQCNFSISCLSDCHLFALLITMKPSTLASFTPHWFPSEINSVLGQYRIYNKILNNFLLLVIYGLFRNRKLVEARGLTSAYSIELNLSCFDFFLEKENAYFFPCSTPRKKDLFQFFKRLLMIKYFLLIRKLQFSHKAGRSVFICKLTIYTSMCLFRHWRNLYCFLITSYIRKGGPV